MITVQETRDIALLRRLFERDRVGAAYLLGDLDPPFFEKGRWLVAMDAGEPIAVVLAFSAFADPVVLSHGAADGVDSIVRDAGSAIVKRPAQDVRPEPGRIGSRPSDPGRPLPHCYLKIPPAHEAAFAGPFDILRRDVMTVMALDRGDYRRPAGGQVIARLDPSFPIERILAVYRSYPGHFFEPGQLVHGVYYGSFEGERLVAVAGTHVFSPAARVACIGNIVTASEARGRGHAAACTSAVIEELYGRGCETIALHVAAGNLPARSCYRRVGFHEHGPVLQLKARLREA